MSIEKIIRKLTLDSIKTRYESSKPTESELENFVEQLIKTQALVHDPEGLINSKRLESLKEEIIIQSGTITIEQPSQTIDDKSSEYKEWLNDNGFGVDGRLDVDWKNWNAYSKYLMNDQNLPLNVIDNIEKDTIQIIKRLEDPKVQGKWFRRGMVVGDVQSGKTGNFLGLANRAGDAGYEYIIIFSGMMNDLRQQTQERADYGLSGYDTRSMNDVEVNYNRNGVGVVNYRQENSAKFPFRPITSNSEKGDMSRHNISYNNTTPPDGRPRVYICKKNVSVIKALLKHLEMTSTNYTDGKIKNPLLMIDDECDNASINTKKPLRNPDTGEVEKEHDLSKINKYMRAVLNLFDRKAYVGYTATPFANCFISRDIEHQEVGEDIFPKDFIINLAKGKNYIGVEDFFGISDYPDSDIEHKDGLTSLIKHVDYDTEAFIQNIQENRTEAIIDTIPGSLKDALDHFILSTACRHFRGDINVHNSMLIHVTLFSKPQDQIAELIDKYIRIKRNEILNSDPLKNPYWRRLKNIWKDEYINVTSQINKDSDLLERLGKKNKKIITPSWEKIYKHILESVKRIVVKQINGNAQDNLDFNRYAEANEYYNFICVGGNKLSRGLTLEGLIISYFIRDSKKYNFDTLLQMGRWFGYRDSYIDLCRIYTSQKLLKDFKDICLATIELRNEFDQMFYEKAKPSEWGLKVKQFPNLNVTARNKTYNAEKVEIQYSGTLNQPRSISKRIEHHMYNKDLIEQTFDLLNFSKLRNGTGFYNHNIKNSSVVNFISKFKSTKDYRGGWFPKAIVDKVNFLDTWSVVITSNSTALDEDHISLANLKVGLSSRTLDNHKNHYEIRNGVAHSTNHLLIGMEDDKELLDKCKVEKIRNGKKGYVYSLPRICKVRGEHMDNSGAMLLFYIIKPKNHNDYLKTPLIHPVILFPTSENKTSGIDYLCDLKYYSEYTQLEMEF